MTDKVQKIREEVKNRYEYWKKKESNSHSIESEIRMSECQHLLLMLVSLQEEPVSKDLEEASKKWLGPQLDKSYAAYGLLRQMELTHFDGYAMLDAIEFGAKWKEEQFKKNLLDACKKQTEEEAEIERDFIEGIIENEHRVPTFGDAIKYGMRLQKEQIMKDAIDAELDDVCGFLTIPIPYHNGIAGDKVKVIIIKSE